VTEDTPPLIAGLWFRPALDEISSWDELDDAWAALAGSTNFLVAEVVDGAWVPIHALKPDQRLAMGSAFKLYILGELADQVRDGAVDWDNPLAIREEWKAAFSAPMSAITEEEERTLR
jgi:beta-lactamase class A